MTVKNLYPNSAKPYYVATINIGGTVHAAFDTTRRLAMGNCYLLAIKQNIK